MAVNDVERVVDFVKHLRGVGKVFILGWSRGASRTAPLYTIRHLDSVAKLVLFAPGYKSLGFAEGFRKYATVFYDKVKVRTSHPSLEGWYLFGSKKEILVPGAFEAYRRVYLASDPKSGESGGSVRVPAGRLDDLLRTNPQFDASKITVPTLVIRGALDTFATRIDNKLLIDAWGSTVKKYVEIPNASHLLPYEKANVQFFKAVKDFLEAKGETRHRCDVLYRRGTGWTYIAGRGGLAYGCHIRYYACQTCVPCSQNVPGHRFSIKGTALWFGWQ